MPSRIYTAPPGTGYAVLGKTLPTVLYEACERYQNPKAFNQPTPDGGWQAYSLDTFREMSEEIALGLHAHNLTKGQRLGFFMRSDVHFALADMGCLMAGLVNVPIYLTQAPEAITYILNHAEVNALVVSDDELLGKFAPLLPDVPNIEFIVTATPIAEADRPTLPEGVALVTMDDLRAEGRAQREAAPDALDTILAQTSAHDLATIIYTSGTTGTPKGVLLTHENISYNGLTSFTGMKGYEEGAQGEIGLSFLPMTHIFARTLNYGYIAYGNSVYYTTPNDLVRDLSRVRPTVFATVPRVLEKVYARIMEKAATMTGAQQRILNWALDLAKTYELGDEPTGLQGLKFKLADKLVYGKWRDVMGGRVKMVICGGAALNGDLANLFAAAGINVLQGYGLTETSPVITYNRPDRNRAGTVGEPIPGVEVLIADDGEILTRGPHVMQGYFKEEEKTRATISEDGWFHTGDIGEFTPEGFLRITDRKKDLFKLSTGKYVMPQPLENQLTTEPVVQQAVVVGNGQKFCGALIFPELEALKTILQVQGIEADGDDAALMQHPRVQAIYQHLVDKANRGMDPWSTIKKFTLIPDEMTIDNGLLTPSLKVKRPRVNERYRDQITGLFIDA